ncbi:MAG TPA: ZIP family metal transporter [Candidatus Norongarragalinales archaeon]|nr:ZIP family metal transporter [Candidatus Norongarragalinales archaeon]
MVLLEIIVATLFVSVLSLAGIVFVVSKSVGKYMGLMVSFAAGTLLALAFLDLLPEALEINENALSVALFGMIAFFVLEKILFWHHHHSKIHYHPLTTLNLVSDGIHNFLDGTIIAAAFLQNTALGVTTTLAVAAHEIPQEFGDYTVLLFGGLSQKRALFYNFLSALTAVAGAMVMFYFASAVPGLSSFMLPFAAGAFIYIAGTDLIPEIRKEVQWKKSLVEFTAFLAGIGLIWLLISIFK